MDAFAAPSSIPNNPIPSPSRTSRHAKVQLLISLLLGLFAFMTFTFLRVKYPQIYIANFSRSNANYLHTGSRRKLPRLPGTLFGWIPVLYRISEEQVLDYAGLDAVVFLGFFKMGIKILSVCLLLAITVITPVRYKFTNRLDDDNDVNDLYGITSKKIHNKYPSFLWMYVVFTYVFTGVVCLFLFDQTAKIIRKRQTYLGQQNSVTDRTVKIIGIPPSLRDDHALKRHIEGLGVGQVDSVVIVKEWNELNRLFKLRKRILRILEEQWAKYFKMNSLRTTSILSTNLQPLGETINMNNRYTDEIGDETNQISNLTQESGSINSSTLSVIEDITSHMESNIMNSSDLESSLPLLNDETVLRPQLKTGFLGILGPSVDSIEYYTQQLDVIDKEIMKARRREYPATSAAFLTMKSVAQAQLLAQAVLDPKINHLITSLAPAPHDVIWNNLYLTRKERNAHIIFVALTIGILSVALVFPVSYIAALLNLKSITKIWPSFGNFLESNPILASIVTNLLPTYIFTIFNIVMPYLYIWITSKQGYTSHSDEELSSVSKNFFYIFVNLFLVFTMAGTVSLTTTTTKFASQFAKSLKEVSLFYVDLIILQGLGIFPYKLLLLGNLIKFPIAKWFWCKTPRDYLNLCKPPVFNFGLQLPQPILILIITIVYSVLSTKILTAGLTYFIIGFFVYKYQLLYACVHPPHSTGKVWILIFRRVIMGLLIFQLTMVGSLALQKAFICASFLSPLPLLTFALLWNFEKSYVPLSIFIALRSLESNSLPHAYQDDEAIIAGDGNEGISTSNARRNSRASSMVANKRPTLDERRELNNTYDYPHLVGSLDPPLIAVDGNSMLFVKKDGTVTKSNIQEDWY